MTLHDDAALAERLRTSVTDLDLVGLGPDLSVIRQRGAARRRRRAAAITGTTAVFIGAVALAVPTLTGGSGQLPRDNFAASDRNSDRLQPSRSPGQTGAAVALDAFRSALDDAGIAYPVQGLETGQPGVWSLGWRSTEPDGVFQFSVTVYSADQFDEGIVPCDASGLPSRNCAQDTLAGGIQLYTGEELIGLTSEPGSAPAWSIRALAVHPGGAFVTAEAALVTPTEQTSSATVAPPYAGPLSQAQLVQLVSNPRLPASATGRGAGPRTATTSELVKAPPAIKLAGTDEFGRITDIASDGTWLRVERVDWLGGQEARQAAADDGVVLDTDYYLRPRPEWTEYRVTHDPAVWGSILLSGTTDHLRSDLPSLVDFVDTEDNARQALFHLDLEDGDVVGIEEKYRP